MREFCVWFLVAGEWVVQEPVQAKSRKGLVAGLEKKTGRKNGTIMVRNLATN